MELKFKNKNGWHIYGWMIHNLELNSTERDIYAIIFGFSQDGDSMFFGGLKYLEQALRISKNTAINTLKKLVEKDLLIKITDVRNGVTFCYYKVNPKFSGELDSLTFLGKKVIDLYSDDYENEGGGENFAPLVKTENETEGLPVVQNLRHPSANIQLGGANFGHTNNNSNDNFNNKERGAKNKFLPPALNDVIEFFKKENIKASPEIFWNHWESVGWTKKGGQKIVKWQSLVPKWEETENAGTPAQKIQPAQKGVNLSPKQKEMRERAFEAFARKTRGFVEQLQADASALETARIKFNAICNHPHEFNSQAVYNEISTYQIRLANSPQMVSEDDLYNLTLNQFKINFFNWFKMQKHGTDLFSETPNKAHRPPQLQNN